MCKYEVSTAPQHSPCARCGRTTAREADGSPYCFVCGSVQPRRRAPPRKTLRRDRDADRSITQTIERETNARKASSR